MQGQNPSSTLADGMVDCWGNQGEGIVDMYYVGFEIHDPLPERFCHPRVPRRCQRAMNDTRSTFGTYLITVASEGFQGMAVLE
ncbi:hypothetical protein D3C78_1514980 [compost metagenome]